MFRKNQISFTTKNIYRRDVQAVLFNMDYYAEKLQDMLINKTYIASQPTYVEKYIPSAGKTRVIAIPKFFPDLCIQWAVMQILEPYFTKGAYYYSVGNMPGKGTRFAKKAVEKWVQNDYKNTKYCLTMDIEKFYPSVNLGILKNMLRKHFKDRDILWLLDEIIDVQDKGLPIGYYSSTWFSNFLLQDLDHKIKEEFDGAAYYIRNVDDMNIYGSNKRKLHRIRIAIENYLNSIGLHLKDTWQVFKYGANRVTDFVGYRFYRTHTLLRKKIALKIKRNAKKISKMAKVTAHAALSLMSMLGWSKHCNCYNFYQKNVKNIVNIDYLKGVIRYESRKRAVEINKLYATIRNRCSYFI
ncbi:MAG: RNA-directed DNA polymerase [Ruminococcaceae bacterium]|nr:RNA-directed DNA polymerase [Oscillospiraceae bacterium]